MSLRLCIRSFSYLRCSAQKYQLRNLGLLYQNSCRSIFYPTKSYFSTHRHLKLSAKDEQESKVELDKYLLASNETLESLSEYFEEVVEGCDFLDNADVEYGDGVLTVKFGEPFGTYVINRQVPNLQIWLSSPTSGPKRYDLIDGRWVYRHDGVSLHTLLNEEITKIVQRTVNFENLPFGTGKS